MFVHLEPLHLLVNMAYLLVFGRLVCSRISMRALWLVYLLSGVAGGAAWLVCGSLLPDGSLLCGASAAVLGLCAYCIVGIRMSFRDRLLSMAALILPFMGGGLYSGGVFSTHLLGAATGALLAPALHGIVPGIDDSGDCRNLFRKFTVSGFDSLTDSERARLRDVDKTSMER